MSDNKNKNTDKTRQIFNIIFACVAIGAAVTAFLLSPLGRRITDKTETTIPPITWEAMESSNVITTEETSETAEVSTTISSDDPSFSVPQPTNPTVDPYKNYTFFIDKSTFDYTLETGVTTLTAKGNKNVTMTVTPLNTTSYTKLCTDTKNAHAALTDKEILKIENLNSCYRSQTGDKDEDIITTVYCIDDGKGGSIEIKYQYPVSAKEYERDFDILLSMFKLI